MAKLAPEDFSAAGREKERTEEVFSYNGKAVFDPEELDLQTGAVTSTLLTMVVMMAILTWLVTRTQKTVAPHMEKRWKLISQVRSSS